MGKGCGHNEQRIPLEINGGVPPLSVGQKQPLLFLDIDGVCCPFGARTGGGDETEVFDYHYDGQRDIYWSEEMTREIEGLTNCFETTWATSWFEDANDSLLPALGIKQRFPVLSLDNTSYPEGTDAELIRDDAWENWKLPSLIATAKDRPFAWVDDDISPAALQWSIARNQTIPTLLLRTRPEYGMTRGDVARLHQFAQAIQRPAS